MSRARRARPRPEQARENDPGGRLVVRHRVVDTLGRMLKAGTIDGAMHDAGREFQRSFALAQLHPLRAADLLRAPGGGRGREAETGSVPLAARDRVHRALLALGGHDSPAGSCAWHVLGCGRSVREWALRQGWGGRPVRQEQAQGMLVAALGLLAAHYGLAGGRAA
ncbi:MAG TPA: DUF6456 domain-containing protein [Geminicoccaceae bacterium]|nr:DUF6456 domain-containing protein [Geminicoccaceae bacterium]